MFIIGIMADSHDNLKALKDAISIFNKRKIDFVIHAGDMISPFTAKEFENLEAELEAIFGNNDGERDGLRVAYKKFCVLDDFKKISVEGIKIAVIHGTQPDLVNALVKSGQYDVVIRGHTHQLSIINGDTLQINPGETCGYLTGRKTVVILDPNDMSYEVIEF